MAWVHVEGGGNKNSGTITLSNPVAIGDLAIFGICNNGNYNTVSDNHSNTWVLAGSGNNGNTFVRMYYTIITIGGSTLVATPGAALTNWSMSIAHFTFNGVISVDHTSNNSGNSSAATPGNITLGATELVYVFAGSLNQTGITAPSGYTTDFLNANDPTFSNVCAAYKLAETANPANPSTAWTGAIPWGCIGASFQGTGGAGGGAALLM